MEAVSFVTCFDIPRRYLEFGFVMPLGPLYSTELPLPLSIQFGAFGNHETGVGAVASRPSKNC